MNRIAKALCLAPLALYSAGAWCDADAYVSIDDFQILVLGPDKSGDLTFDAGSGSSSQEQALAYGVSATATGTTSSTKPFGAISANTDIPGAFTDASIGGKIIGSGSGSAAVQAIVSATSGPDTASSSLSFGGSSGSLGFTLAPFTTVEISGSGLAYALWTGTQPTEQASASFSMSIHADGVAATPDDSVSLSAFADHTTAANVEDSVSYFNLTFSNSTGDSVHGSIDAVEMVSAMSESPVAPVPEANAALLPLLGMAWLARRKSMRQRASSGRDVR